MSYMFYASASATTSGAAQPETPYVPNGYASWATYIPALTGVQMYWGNFDNNESGFDVQRSVDNVNFTTIQHLGPDQTSYLDASVQPDSIYYYRVCATAGADDSVKSPYIATAAVNTPGVAIDVQSDQTDPARNPEIWLNDEDANDNGTPDYQENGPISGETDLVPVQVNVPLGADRYGTATLSWGSGIKLWSDANKTTLLGTGTGYGGYTMNWDVNQEPASRTFYAEGVAGSALLGNQPIYLATNLMLKDPTTNPPTNPTTVPSTTQPTTVPAEQAVSVVLGKVLRVGSMPWEESNEPGQHGLDGVAIPDVTTQPVYNKAGKIVKITVEIDGRIVIDSSSTDKAGTYGHEQKHLEAVIAAVEKLVADMNGQKGDIVLKELNDKIQDIVTRNQLHAPDPNALPGAPKNSTPYHPDGTFPKDPIPFKGNVP